MGSVCKIHSQSYKNANCYNDNLNNDKRSNIVNPVVISGYTVPEHLLKSWIAWRLILLFCLWRRFYPALRAEVGGLDGFPAVRADHGIDYWLRHKLLSTFGAELGVRGERCAALGTLGLGLGGFIEREIEQKPVDTHAQEIRKTCADAEVAVIVIPGDKIVKT